MTALADLVLAALPQTQCTRCGYRDCAAYAQAIALGEAGINQCPPGGAQGIERLARLTGQPFVNLDPRFGIEGPRSVAFIDENWCIGCTLCVTACPTDAIVGSNKMMHTVLEAFCTGCELCLPVCPVDCIELENVTGKVSGWAAWSPEQAELARSRHQRRADRQQRELDENSVRLEQKALLKRANPGQPSGQTDAVVTDKKRAVIESALQRARDRRAAGNKNS
jgi:electron transport complex protein RnfB